MFTRKLILPNHTSFLLGPRGIGKSMWLKQSFMAEQDGTPPYFDLLSTKEALQFSREPYLLYNQLQNLSAGSWVVIDEIQKVPALLNEVHRLIEDKKLQFILCGSSARKLKTSGTNLLAGRAHTIQMFPFVSSEVNFDFELFRVFKYGMLPMAYGQQDPTSYLTAYAETYLQEEIKAEALTRNIGGFSRFLEVAARQNGQITNVSAIARDAQVARQTVQGFFDILVDTLVGYWLPAWKLKRATKQKHSSKFYLFDPGVVRALSGRLPYPPTPEENGTLLECFILNELRAYMSYSGLGFPLYYWSSPDRVEVDILFETTKGFVALEIKVASRWDQRFGKGLLRIAEEIKENNVQCIGIYLGDKILDLGKIRVLPCIDFLRELWNGQFV